MTEEIVSEVHIGELKLVSVFVGIVRFILATFIVVRHRDDSWFTGNNISP
jgi:hypothetical protein